jgi:hypothetical protein
MSPRQIVFTLLLVFVQKSTPFITTVVGKRENFKCLNYEMTCPPPEVLSKAEPRSMYNIFLQKPMGDTFNRDFLVLLLAVFYPPPLPRNRLRWLKRLGNHSFHRKRTVTRKRVAPPLHCCSNVRLLKRIMSMNKEDTFPS